MSRPKLAEHEKCISPEEKRRLLAYLDKPRVEFTRPAAIMRTILKTGLRCSEVAHLKVEHCHLYNERPWIDVYGGKMRDKDHADAVKIGKTFAAFLAEYIEVSKAKVFVFEGKGHGLTRNTIWTDCKGIYKRLRFSHKYACHALRHRYVTDAYKAFRDPMQTMVQARHKSLGITTRYIHLADEESPEFRQKLEVI